MNDSEYALRWRTLAAQLHELERAAGIGDAASSWRDAILLSTRPAHEFGSDKASEEYAGTPHLFPLDAVRRRELRELYFSVSRAAMRRNLISKQRELELFERAETRARLEDARIVLERRP